MSWVPLYGFCCTSSLTANLKQLAPLRLCHSSTSMLQLFFFNLGLCSSPSTCSDNQQGGCRGVICFLVRGGRVGEGHPRGQVGVVGRDQPRLCWNSAEALRIARGMPTTVRSSDETFVACVVTRFGKFVFLFAAYRPGLYGVQGFTVEISKERKWCQ